MAFLSLGSVASDLSFTHLINHILIPELSQSERLTDTQLQGTSAYIIIVISNFTSVCEVFAALTKISPNRYKPQIIHMCLQVIGIDSAVTSEFMFTPKAMSLQAVLKIMKILNESNYELPVELFSQILEQLKYGNSNADDLLDVLRSFFKNQTLDLNRSAWTDLILEKIFQSSGIAAAIPFEINALFMFFPYILHKIQVMRDNTFWNVIKVIQDLYSKWLLIIRI